MGEAGENQFRRSDRSLYPPDRVLVPSKCCCSFHRRTCSNLDPPYLGLTSTCYLSKHWGKNRSSGQICVLFLVFWQLMISLYFVLDCPESWTQERARPSSGKRAEKPRHFPQCSPFARQTRVALGAMTCGWMVQSLLDMDWSDAKVYRLVYT